MSNSKCNDATANDNRPCAVCGKLKDHMHSIGKSRLCDKHHRQYYEYLSSPARLIDLMQLDYEANKRFGV
jgi:hypothetical protein